MPLEGSVLIALDRAGANGPRIGLSGRICGTHRVSMPSPSRPTASAFSPGPTTRRRGCGTRRPEPRSRRSKDTKTVSCRSPSRPTASASSPAPGTRRQGCGTRRLARGRDARGTQRRCQCGRLLARRQARSHRFLRQDGQAVGRGDWRRGRNAGGTQRRLSLPSPSRPMASASSPAPWTGRRGCGTRLPGPRRDARRHTALSMRSPSRPTASAFSPAPEDKTAQLVGHGDRRPGRDARRTRRHCLRRRLLARRPARSHRLPTTRPQGCGTRRPAPRGDARGTHRPCQGGRLLA